MSDGKLKGKQIEKQSISLDANITQLAINSYTVSNATFAYSEKQITNKEYVDFHLSTKLSNTQLDNGIATSSIWSGDYIQGKLDGLTFSYIEIDDNNINLYSVWSSSKINTELSNKADDNIVVKTSGAQTVGGKKTFTSVPSSNQDASGGNDLIRKSQFDTSLNLKADQATTYTKIEVDNDLNLKLNKSQLDNGIATSSIWSGDYIQGKLDGLTFSYVEINDTITVSNAVWSSQHIQSKFDNFTAGVEIDDQIRATESTWSSFKIGSELDFKLSDTLSQSHMIIGNTADKAVSILSIELYEDSIDDIILNENFLYDDYSTVSLGQRIESIQQLAERTTQGWVIIDKDPGKEITYDIDVSDSSVYASNVIDVGNYLNADVLKITNNTNPFSITVSTVAGLYRDFKISFEVESGGKVVFEHNDYDIATTNQMVNLNSSNYTIVGGDNGNRYTILNKGSLHYQTDVNIYSVRDISISTYTIELNNMNNDEYFGIGASTTSVTIPDAINNGKVVILKDEAGNAGSSNITINGNIDGGSSTSITTNYGSIKLIWNDNKWWII